jgi:N-acetylglucosaminyl-diphospho-decaprenol L-rhamnosyltransferase
VIIASESDQQVGLWDSRFFLYSEETDYAKRMRCHGFTVEYVSTACAEHAGGGSGTSDELTALMAINRVRFAERWSCWRRLFSGKVIVDEAIRTFRRDDRAALRVLVHRGRWSELMLRLQGSGTEIDQPRGVARKEAGPVTGVTSVVGYGTDAVLAGY